MQPELRVLPGQTDLLRTLRDLEARAVPAAAAGLYEWGQRVIAASVPLVPVVTGTLRANHFVYPPQVEGTQVSVVFGYGGAASAYARRTHENPRAGKTGGVSPSGRRYLPGTYSEVGQYHFLSEPVEAAQATVVAEIGTILSRMLGR